LKGLEMLNAKPRFLMQRTFSLALVLGLAGATFMARPTASGQERQGIVALARMGEDIERGGEVMQQAAD
jgi:hypothetical protein